MGPAQPIDGLFWLMLLLFALATGYWEGKRQGFRLGWIAAQMLDHEGKPRARPEAKP